MLATWIPDCSAVTKPRRRSNDDRREQSTEQVLTAALHLFASNGFKATSIDQIAAAAKLTKGAVYFYFKDKSALLIELLERSRCLYQDIFDQMNRSEQPASVQLDMFIDWAARIGADNNQLLLLPILVSLEFYGREDKIRERVDIMYRNYHAQMARVYELGVEQGEFRAELPVTERAAALVAFTDGMLLEWYRHGDKLDGGSLATAARELIFSGIRR